MYQWEDWVCGHDSKRRAWSQFHCQGWGMSYSSVQFQCCLPGKAPTGFWFNPVKLPLSPTTNLRCQSQAQVHCASDPLAISWKFTPPFPWLWLVCQNGSQNSERHFYLLDYKFIIKGCNSGIARRKRSMGEVWGKTWSVHAPSECAALLKSPHVHPPGSSRTQSFWGFYGNVTTLAWLIKSLAISDWFNHQPLFPPQSLGLVLKVPTSNHLVGSTGNQLPSLSEVQKSPHKHNKMHYSCSLHLGNSQDFRSSESQILDKDDI